jgi:hypothetical protein
MNKRNHLPWIVSVAVLVILAATGCAGKGKQLPMAEQIVVAAAPSSGINGEALAKGRSLAVTECVSCHRFFWPQEYAPEAWMRIARRMGRLASLTSAQIDNLELYLVEASRISR